MPSTSLSSAAAADLATCREILSRGSKSFALASRLLPARLRDSAAALYAFCRVADDAVDEDAANADSALADLRRRLAGIERDRPDEHPVDRALARVVAATSLPVAPLEALLEGFEWDVKGRHYHSMEDVFAYGARVAGTIGVLMTVLMGRREPHVLARACDLGVAMQLTNIARDVGEDARNGRLYLPRTELLALGVEPEAWLREPRFTPEIAELVRRLMSEAELLYARSDSGVPLLPADCRLPIRSARLVYSDIHRSIISNHYDTVSQRAYTSKPRKLYLIAKAFFRGLLQARSPELEQAPPLEAVRFLCQGAPHES